MASDKAQKVPLATLTAMVVGGMVGAGVFSIPRNFAQATGVYGALIAWAIAGTGMLMLGFVFQTLANRKPDLDAGVYAYARAGFGPYLGFISAFGYWASACVGNVSYWVLIKSTLGRIFPALGEGNTVLSVALSSVGIWAFHMLVMRGVKEAAGINKVVTIAKVIPLLLFIVLALFFMNGDVFAANLLGGDAAVYGSLFQQVNSTMLVTVFVFLGIEGASNYSRFAEKRSDVGVATVTGFLGVLALFASVSILSYGILPSEEIARLSQPSVGGVLEAAVGPWGAVFIGVGVIVSVLGAYLAWTLMAAEVLSIAAKKLDMPAFLGRENAAQVPTAALLITSSLIQLVLLATLFSDDAFTFALSLCSHMSLIPYFLSAAYMLKLVLTRETYDKDPGSRQKDLIIAGLATAYTVFLLVAAGMKFMLLGLIIYAPGTLLYYITRREQRLQLFSPAEWALFAAVVIGAVVGIHGLVTGYITI
ncbi:MAG: basic amino acid/polyamine antiporter [Deltaproteobacteria bacterium]|nr:basic amino acid/polyamine antiporter [Deltaproteobacteria bacterium]